MKRVRSVITPKRDPTADQMENLIDTMEGRNNGERRKMPAVDQDQTIKALIADAAKEKCYLDEQEPSCVMIYRVPAELQGQGQRLILYTLCAPCRLDITSAAKAEAKLVSHLRQENGQSPLEVQ